VRHDRQPRPADLFTPIAGVDPDVLAGLTLLARSSPLWPVGTDQWLAAVATVRAFSERFDAEARACAWDSISLYGLSKTAPYANLASMGAGWLAAKSGHRVAAVTARDTLLITSTGAKLRIFRGEPDRNAALAWTLCRPAELQRGL
jgi:hypothetical protein